MTSYRIPPFLSDLISDNDQFLIDTILEGRKMLMNGCSVDDAVEFAFIQLQSNDYEYPEIASIFMWFGLNNFSECREQYYRCIEKCYQEN